MCFAVRLECCFPLVRGRFWVAKSGALSVSVCDTKSGSFMEAEMDMKCRSW